MQAKIKQPNLLQCSRVNVLDVRPVLRKGKEPFDSIQYSLSSLNEESTLLIVTPFEPQPLEKYVKGEGYSFHHDQVDTTMHWLAVHLNDVERELEINGPGASYVLQGGCKGYVVFLDCRELAAGPAVDWINSTLLGLGSDDLLVVHSPAWDDGRYHELKQGTITRKTTISERVRLEIRKNDGSA